ncbi:baseplate assembly protein [Pseudenhygromyxa sp. WMMC2535]|uniref:phage baseplate assembly protein V n=1 Tax=Pseudenhygromyxa sp. WMMC2535 TaxID=2712867 RepID=UPI001595CF0F|nr:phage baseplate assembly protein V [Pseudenhygromyxa sp. WMMC2535]NVB36420.1 baseplate assembly protein [Pseudenhygromyxa sp. WMMC2535]
MRDQCEFEDTALTAIEGRWFGKYRGKVMDNQDPEDRGRLLVTVPAPLQDEEVWAVPCVPYAGPGVGTYMIPPIGARVWVEFEGGDTCLPIWSGCYWASDEAPETNPGLKVIKTEKFTITIDDNQGILTIENREGTRLEIDGTKMSVEAVAQIIHRVGLMKTTLDVTKFDVHDGAMSVS